MLIDWFTVFAQLVNFLILMALLKRFLYKPILRALDDREKKIAGQLEEARKIKADAERELSEYVSKNEQFAHRHTELLQQAQDEARHERNQLIEAARAESNALRAGWHKALENEQLSLHRDIIRHTREEIFAITRKTLADLAAESLEQRIAEVFIQRLRALSEPEKKQFTLAIRSSTLPVVVRSAFELSPEQQKELQQAVREVLAVDASIKFETDAGQIGGIELNTNGHKLSWTIDDYLMSLERSIDRVLAAKTAAPIELGGGDHAAG